MRTIFFLCFLCANFFVVTAQNPSKGSKSMGDMMNLGKNKIDASKIPSQYAFTWKYTMQINTGKSKNMEVDYFLQPNGGYFGSNFSADKKGNMFMIMDTKRKIMITTFGNGENKMAMAMAMAMPDYSKMGNNEQGKLTYKAIAGKDILGYKCKGMQATNDKMSIVFYYTSEAKVTFSEMFSASKMMMPDFYSSFFKANEKPLTLEVVYTDLTNKKVTTMKCLALEKQNLTFNKSDYKFM